MDDYVFQELDHLAGRIMAKPVSGGRVVWFWTLTGPYLPDDLQPSQGGADTLLEAKTAFREKFDRWLAWATALQQPVVGIGRRAKKCPPLMTGGYLSQRRANGWMK